MADTEFGQTTGRNTDENLELHLAVAIYLATYADGNESTKQLFEGLKDEPEHASLFWEFLQVVLGDDSDFDRSFSQQMKEGGIEAYRASMKRIANGDTQLQTRMLSIRKFFSCPWLICPDQLLGNLK